MVLPLDESNVCADVELVLELAYKTEEHGFLLNKSKFGIELLKLSILLAADIFIFLYLFTNLEVCIILAF